MANSFFWLHIKKAGGSSFRKAFTPPYVATNRTNAGTTPFIALPKEEYNDALNNFRLPLGAYDYKRMLFAQTFLYTQSEFNSMYKFCIVRNPYTRIFSAWKYLMNYETELNPTPTINKQFIKMKKDFTYFLECLPEFWENKNNRHIATHTAPIWADISDYEGNCLVDAYYKLEELGTHADELCRILEISPRALGIENKGKANRNTSFFTKKKSDFHAHMKKQKNVQLIETYYQSDITQLQYRLELD